MFCLIKQPMCALHVKISRLPPSLAVAAYTTLTRHCQDTLTLKDKEDTKAPLWLSELLIHDIYFAPLFSSNNIQL